MLFFLIVLGILIIFITISMVILLSNLRIEIKNFRYGNIKENKHFNIKIGILFLGKVKILSLNLDNQKIKEIINSKQLKKLDMKNIENNIKLNKENLSILKYLKIKIEKLNLIIDIGTEDAILTSYIVSIIASLISIILPHIATKIYNIKYKVNPLFRNKNEFNIDLYSIIDFKIISIVYMIYILVKNNKEQKQELNKKTYYDYVRSI